MYPVTRSVNAELRIGSREGSIEQIGKDWGGPNDPRSCPPLSPDEALRDTPGQD